MYQYVCDGLSCGGADNGKGLLAVLEVFCLRMLF